MEAFSHKCPSCNANIFYNTDLLKWKCDYCGQTFSLEQVYTYEQNDKLRPSIDDLKIAPNEEILDGSTIENQEMNLYTCSNCGAQLVTDENTSATFCVYCGSSSLVKDRLSGEFKPDYMIPFTTSKELAKTKFKSFIKEKLFVPNKFIREENVQKITGVYIPFWTYDNKQHLAKSGKGTNIRSWTSGNYTYTKTDIYEFERDVDILYDDVPVDGSKKFNDDLMDSIEPFDYNKKVKFDPRYLSGFLAEKYDVNKEDAYKRAKLRMDNSSKNLIDYSINFTKKKVCSSSQEETKGEINYWLLPVWMLNTKFRGKQYQFAMNGESGKFVGKLPVSIPKLLGMVLLLLIPALFIGYLLNSVGIWLVSNPFDAFSKIMGLFFMAFVIAGIVLFAKLIIKEIVRNRSRKKGSNIGLIIIAIILALITLGPLFWGAISLLQSHSYASTQTFTRTEDNLGITKDFTINNKVKQAALSTPKVDASEKIYDFADLFTAEEEQSLYENVINFINGYNMDMAIVTINSNPKKSSMDYADDFYDYNDFGIDNVYSGVLFLIDMDNRIMWISTTGQAILIYDDYRIERILDDTYEYVTKDNYKCANTFISKASSYAAQGVPNSNYNYEINSSGNYVRKGSLSFIDSLDFTKGRHSVHFILVFAIVADIIVIIILLIKNKTVKTATTASAYINKVRWNVTNNKLIHTHTSRVYHSPDSGGGYGGGSSTHSSSSGSSHGGGGRSF